MSKHGNESEQTQHFLQTQVQRIDSNENLLHQILQEQLASKVKLDELSRKMQSLENKLGVQLLSWPPSAASHPVASGSNSSPGSCLCEPDIRPSEHYDGDPDQCGGFLLQCHLSFMRSPSLFPTPVSKITYLVSALKGKALCWSHAFLQSHSMETLTYETFLQEFKRVFQLPLQQEAGKRLLTLKQGLKTVADHSIDFRIMAERTGWNELALQGTFLNSLSKTIRDKLATCDEPQSLDELINLSIRIDNRLRERRNERMSSYRPWTPTIHVTSEGPSAEHPLPETMQAGRGRLSPEERLRRFGTRVCIYCGKKGHFLANCPVRGKEQPHQ